MFCLEGWDREFSSVKELTESLKTFVLKSGSDSFTVKKCCLPKQAGLCLLGISIFVLLLHAKILLCLLGYLSLNISLSMCVFVSCRAIQPSSDKARCSHWLLVPEHDPATLPPDQGQRDHTGGRETHFLPSYLFLLTSFVVLSSVTDQWVLCFWAGTTFGPWDQN